MENLPFYIYLVFGLTVLLSLFLFYKAANQSKIVLAVIIIWIVIQSAVSLTGFYKTENTIPPRFALLLMPPLLSIIVLFSTRKGRLFIDGLDIKALTLLHIIRIPVELVLLWLCLYKMVPELMTFEGRNFDIFSGISAPFIYYFGFIKKNLNKSVILLWNFICLALLLNIAFNAVFSLPTLFQKFAFEQPNVALLVFPFILLPSVLVPMVLFSHLASIRKIVFTKA